MSTVFTPTHYKLSVEDYHKLGEAGILDEDSRVELIEGELIEVADTTLAYDRTTKLRLYAKAGIVEAWIVDVQSQLIESYRQPAEGRYTHKTVHCIGDSISPFLLPQIGIQISDVFR
jgi:Uma2 family endonuclease